MNTQPIMENSILKELDFFFRKKKLRVLDNCLFFLLILFRSKNISVLEADSFLQGRKPHGSWKWKGWECRFVL